MRPAQWYTRRPGSLVKATVGILDVSTCKVNIYDDRLSAGAKNSVTLVLSMLLGGLAIGDRIHHLLLLGQ